ncbi:MAG: AAA family ATPase, partial [Bacteroidota bacterium]
ATTSTTERVSVDELKSQREEFQLKLDIAISNLASLNGSLQRLRSQVSGFSSKESALSVLEQDVDNALKEYNNALEKYNEYKNQALVSGTSIRQIKKGQPALEPESSKTLILTGLAGIVSLFLCVGSIVLMEVIDARIKTIPQFERATKLELSGFINKINTKKLILKELFTEDGHSKELTKFKQLLRKIRFELESTDSSTVLVTSPKIGEGKTFVIMCLAYSLSLIKKRVLIIDTNFKNNSLTSLLMVKPNFQKAIEKESRVGSRLLLNQHEGTEEQTRPSANEEDSEANVEDNIISKTAHQNIDIIGSKRGNSSPSEILSGRDFKGMLEVFKNDYDYILMEGASLNEYPDTKELVGFVDVVLPVFSADTSLKQVDRDSIKYLKSLNGKLMGSILNKVENQNLKT